MLDFLNSTLGIICSILTILTVIAVPSIIIKKKNSNRKGNINNGSGVTIIGDGNVVGDTSIHKDGTGVALNDIKNIVQILFIDDEDFNVIKMLKKAGWKNIKRIPDFANLDIID